MIFSLLSQAASVCCCLWPAPASVGWTIGSGSAEHTLVSTRGSMSFQSAWAGLSDRRKQQFSFLDLSYLTGLQHADAPKFRAKCRVTDKIREIIFQRKL